MKNRIVAVALRAALSSLAKAVSAAAGSKIDMEVIVVRIICSGSQNRGEIGTGTAADRGLKERVFVRFLVPWLHNDRTFFFDQEAMHIQPVCEGVFTVFAGARSSLLAALIGGPGLQTGQAGTQEKRGHRRHNLGNPV